MKERGRVKDHLGNTYGSISELAKANGISASVLESRLRKGMGMLQALSLPSEAEKEKEEEG